MNSDNAFIDVLGRECDVFCRYLVKQEPDDYIRKKYQKAHQVEGSTLKAFDDAFDTKLLKIATVHHFATRVVDAYTAIFFKHSIVRKKLILLLAILESCASTCRYLDSFDQLPKSALFLRIVNYVAAFSVVILIGMIILFPIRIITITGQKIFPR